LDAEKIKEFCEFATLCTGIALVARMAKTTTLKDLSHLRFFL